MTAPPALFALDPAGQDVFGEIERARTAGPVPVVELPGGLQARMATRYDLIVRLLKDPRVSKDAPKHWGDMRAGRVPEDSPLIPWTVGSGMFTAGGKEHRRLRSLANGPFTRSRVTALEPMIDQIVRDTLTDLAAHAGEPGRTVVDLRKAFCFPVPIATISALLGLDDDLFDAVRAGADALFDATVTPTQFAFRFGELNMAIAELVDRKEHNPGGQDLTSALIRATTDDGTRYSRDELLETIRVIVVAGYETTVNLIDQCVFALLTHPEYLQAVREGRIAWADVIDETLRWASPAANLPLRYATEDIDVDGDTITQGEAILISFAGAGRDPAKHNAPDVFNPRRANRDHLGFGYGSHYCLGANLAITEAEYALSALFTTYPDMELAEPANAIPANPGFITNGHARLLVRLTGK